MCFSGKSNDDNFREVKVMTLKTGWGFILLMILLSACGNNSKVKQQKGLSQEPDSVYIPSYANRFKIEYYPNYKRILVQQPWDSLAPAIETILSTDKNILKQNPSSIEIPVKKWVALTSTQISYAHKINVLDQLVGMAEPEYVSNQKVQDGIKEGSIKNIGKAYSPDLEILIALNPDMMMISPFKEDLYGPARNAGIRLCTNSSYLENTPLGRVEWLVYVSAFFNKEEHAIQIVKDVASRYEKAKNIAKNAIHRPKVMTGKIFQGVWYVPAAQSYNANFLKDAGVNYIFKDKPGTGSLAYDFETVYAQGADCDFWSLMVNYDGEYSYSALKNEDVRYEDFKPFADKKVVYSNTSYSLIYEKGLLEPDVILCDYIKLFHPELLPEHELSYYQILDKD